VHGIERGAKFILRTALEVQLHRHDADAFW
jgi:hypothetical protein